MSNGVGSAASDNERWIRAARESGIEVDDPNGKTTAQTREAQKSKLAGGLEETGGETAAKAIAFATHGKVAVLAGAGGVLLTGWVHIKALYEANAQAQELKDASARDAVNLAIVWTASAVLPRDYVARMGYELRAVAGEHGGASKILTPLMKDDVRWQSIKARCERDASYGRNLAKKLNITTPQALEKRLQSDPTFARVYNGNMAFKHGVASYVFECERQRIASGR